MKKIFALVLICLMVFATVLPVAADEYVASPSLKEAPKMEVEGGNGTATLTSYSYKDKDKMPEEVRVVIEAAYNTIMNAEAVTDLCPALADMAKKEKMASEDLVISDIFDIDCSEADGGSFKVKLTTEEGLNVVALLHYTNGAWEMVDAKIKDGVVSFEGDNFSPFAFVVYTGEGGNGGSLVWLWIVLAVLVVAAVAVVVFFMLKKKKTPAAD